MFLRANAGREANQLVFQAGSRRTAENKRKTPRSQDYLVKGFSMDARERERETEMKNETR